MPANHGSNGASGSSGTPASAAASRLVGIGAEQCEQVAALRIDGARERQLLHFDSSCASGSISRQTFSASSRPRRACRRSRTRPPAARAPNRTCKRCCRRRSPARARAPPSRQPQAKAVTAAAAASMRTFRSSMPSTHSMPVSIPPSSPSVNQRYAGGRVVDLEFVRILRELHAGGRRAHQADVAARPSSGWCVWPQATPRTRGWRASTANSASALSSISSSSQRCRAAPPGDAGRRAHTHRHSRRARVQPFELPGIEMAVILAGDRAVEHHEQPVVVRVAQSRGRTAGSRVRGASPGLVMVAGQAMHRRAGVREQRAELRVAAGVVVHEVAGQQDGAGIRMTPPACAMQRASVRRSQRHGPPPPVWRGDACP